MTQIPDQPIDLLSDYVLEAQGKQALDIACGMGRHTRFLASHGFAIDALDISTTAIASLQGIAGVNAKEVDFDTYLLSPSRYDLIVCTYFLERRLFPQIVDALKDNGLFIFETFLYHPENERQPSQKSFLLESGELEATFGASLEIVHLSEWWDRDYTGVKMMKGSLVARKK